MSKIHTEVPGVTDKLMTSIPEPEPKGDTTPLQNAIIIGSMIGSIMNVYDPRKREERLKPIQVVRQRVKKMMFSRARSNTKDYVKAVLIADKAWQAAIDEFKERGMRIEVAHTVAALYARYEEPMAKYALLREKHMEAFELTAGVPLEGVEYNSYEVAHFIIDYLAPYTGIKRLDLSHLKNKA